MTTEQISGWIIANGKREGEGLAYRFIDNDAGGVMAWTPDIDKALRLARREDAEAFCHHDEDAWRILPVMPEPEPTMPCGHHPRHGVTYSLDNVTKCDQCGARHPTTTLDRVIQVEERAQAVGVDRRLDIFRQALAWGYVYGPILGTGEQWDRMRDKMARQFRDQFEAAGKPASALTLDEAIDAYKLEAVKVGEFDAMALFRAIEANPQHAEGLRRYAVVQLTYKEPTREEIEADSQGAERIDWVSCPICGESDMRRTTSTDGDALIDCVNHACASNGGRNSEAMGR